MNTDYKRLVVKLGYKFADEILLKHALTHKSYGKPHNERFEFLGDSVLNFIIAEALFELLPNHAEGDLTRLRASLVKGETLAQIALELNLSEYLLLGEGELKSGGFRRPSILADAVEAIIAAIYLEGGFSSCKKSVLSLYASRLTLDFLNQSTKDSKTQLQEFLQQKSLALPEYVIVHESGNPHVREFSIECRVKKYDKITSATSDSKKSAEKLAAKKMLDLILNA